MPLVERKGALRAVIAPGTQVQFTDHVAGGGQELARAVAAAGLPAAVAKRADSKYSGGPSPEWKRIPVSASASGGSLSEALATSAESARSERGRVRFTNLDKVFWPAEGYTKGDLVHYYETVAPVLVPHLRDRPVHMNRFPNGIEGKSFYQRQAKEDTPPWVETVPISSESKGETVSQLVVTCTDTLLWMANQGSIDLHPWLSRRGSLESPDWAVLDLDPKEAPFTDVVKIAREIGMLLRGVGLRPLLKTSGKTGLHVFVPLEEGYTYDQSRMFCEAVARIVVRALPDIATVERNPGGRAGKVYVDFLQNRRSQTVVPPYSVRPVPGASVSTPLFWDELDSDLTPRRFTILTTPERIERHGDLFAKALTDRQGLLPAIAALGEHLASG
jgi:bifunctional non-homologous end joining protein LigD